MQHSSGPVYIGIDQKGGTYTSGRKKGSAVPLPVALSFVNQSQELTLLTSDLHKRPLTLESLQRGSLEKLMMSVLNRKLNQVQISILADCVLGLPKALVQSAHLFQPQPEGQDVSQTRVLEYVFRRILELQRDQNFAANPGLCYGRKAAETFFNETFPEAYPQIPRRAEELELKANSVFAPRPYQRNIQTGTFRFWTDLATDPDAFRSWLLIWPEEKPTHDKVILGEGYPSSLWKSCVSSETRNPSVLLKWLKERGFKLSKTCRDVIENDPDWADSAVLAASLALTNGFDSSRIQKPLEPIEGAIFRPILS